MINKKIWITFRRKGIHKFPGASNPQFEDVNYLQFPHRHLFHFKVKIEVYHNDREIEFHQFLNWIESLYDGGTLELDYKSCEMISDDLAKTILERYPNRSLTIEISEDGECGSESDY